MSTKLFLITLMAFLGVSQFANAGVMLFVHFGDNAPDTIDGQNIVSTYTPNGANEFKASIYLHLTGGTLYGYRFSIRFNEDLLELKTQEQARGLFGDHPTGSLITPNLGAPATENTHFPLPLNFVELRNFNGYLDSSNIVDGGYYKVADISFEIQKSLTPGEKLLTPGPFEFYPNDVFPPSDFFLTEDSNPQVFVPNDNDGSVAITSVPEPTSVLILGLLGLVAYRRKGGFALKNA